MNPTTAHAWTGPSLNTTEQPARNNAAWNSRPWLAVGEVEDFGLGVATGTVKLEARTLGGVGSKFDYQLTNVSSTLPSYNTASVTTTADGNWTASGRAHAFSATNSPVVINAATLPTGWQLGTRQDASHAPIDTYCFDPATGSPVAITVNSSSQLTLAASAVQQGASVICRLTYVPIMSLASSSLTTTPTPDPANPQAVTLPASTGGSYSLKAKLAGRVMDADGVMQDVAVQGQEVGMTLAPVAATGATATGAAFGNGSQTAACTTNASGECTLQVTAAVAGTYSVTARANVGGVATPFSTNATPGATRHPAELYFKSGGLCLPPPATAFELDNTGDRLANRTDFRSATVRLRDCADNALTGKGADLSISVTLNGNPLTQGSDYWVDNLAETAAGSGDYTFRIRTVRAGTLQVTVSYDEAGTPQSLGTRPASFIAESEICVDGSANPDCLSSSRFVITPKTPMPYADWQFASKAPNTWGFYEGVITLVGPNDNPVTDGVGRITMSDVTAAPLRVNGARFWSTQSDPPLTGADNALAVTCSVPLVAGECPSGVYTVRIYSIFADIRQVRASGAQTGGGSVIIGTKPAEFNVWSVPAHNQTRMLVSPPASSGLSPDGSAAYTVSGEVMDENGHNPIENAPVTFNVTTSTATPTAGGATMTPGAASQPVLTSPLGLAQITVTAVAPEGDYVASARYDGADVGNPASLPASQKSPQTLTFREGDDLDLSKTTKRVSSDLIVADGNDTGTITVMLISTSGLPMTGREAQLSATGPTGVALSFSAFSPTSTLGQYTATVSGTDSGDHLIRVFYQGTTEITTLAAPNPNTTAHFISGPPDPGKSSLSIAPCVAISPSHPGVSADGNDCYEVTAILVDGNDNPVTDWYDATPALNRYSVAVTPVGAVLSDPVQGPNGTYKIKVTSTTPTTYGLDFAYTWPGQAPVALTPTLTAAFMAQNWDVTHSYYTATPIPPAETEVGTAGAVITLYAFNLADQPVDLASSEIAALAAKAELPAGTAATIGAWTRQALGVYTATVSATVAGDYTATVSTTQSGASVDVPYQTNRLLRFKPGPVDWQKTLNSLDTDPSANMADGRKLG
ncbi:MAG: hypothetical protein FWD29_10030, partial [Micrococcales bacterium]|nr:hypothetical protein [Micrococcales bacterium]